VESYTGVGISVSFNSKVMDEQQKIQQLSGGQKSKFLNQTHDSFFSLPSSLLCLRVRLSRFVRSLPHLRPPGSRIKSIRHF
jgi:hypothetical protein